MLQIAAYNIKAILEGGLSLLPGCGQLFQKGTRRTDSARYCYSVWMRHLVKTHAYRRVPFNGVVVELGPGDSLGTGLAVLLSGANHYIAVDVARHANSKQNMKVLEELVSLFAKQTPIPNNNEFPEVKPHINDFSFPASILNADWMEKNLSSKRLQIIADCFCGTAKEKPLLQYIDPITASTIISPDSVDLVFSQAVLEHAENLTGVYQTCHSWLKPDGLVSHQIDFRSHGTAREWNGHWAYSDVLWRLIRGNRPYLLNREPCGTHLRLLAENGYQIAIEERSKAPSRLEREQLAARFQKMPQQDLTTSGIYVVAEKNRRAKRLVEQRQE